MENLHWVGTIFKPINNYPSYMEHIQATKMQRTSSEQVRACCVGPSAMSNSGVMHIVQSSTLTSKPGMSLDLRQVATAGVQARD